MVSYKRTCSSKSFLNCRLTTTRLLIEWFLIKKHVVRLFDASTHVFVTRRNFMMSLGSYCLQFSHYFPGEIMQNCYQMNWYS